MANMNQAPFIRYNGEKNKDTRGWGKAIRTHELESKIMCGLGDRDMVALKIMLFLTGNADGFQVAEKTIMDRCNISESAYKKARKKLVDELGWITHVPGKAIIVNYGVIYNGKGSSDDTPILENDRAMGYSDNTSKGCSEKSPLGYSDNTHNNISDNINKQDNEVNKPEVEEGSKDNPIVVSKEWLIERHNAVYTCGNGLFYYNNKFYRMEEPQ